MSQEQSCPGAVETLSEFNKKDQTFWRKFQNFAKVRGTLWLSPKNCEKRLHNPQKKF